MLVLNLILAIVWMVLQTSFTWPDFVVGLAVGFMIIWLTEGALQWQRPGAAGSPARPANVSYARRSLKIVGFIGFVLAAIVRSNLDVARIVLSPRPIYRPGIVGVPLDVQSDLGITLLASVITITPGTVALDVSSDRRTMYIHTIDVRDADELRAEIKEQFERRVMEIFP